MFWMKILLLLWSFETFKLKVKIWAWHGRFRTVRSPNLGRQLAKHGKRESVYDDATAGALCSPVRPHQALDVRLIRRQPIIIGWRTHLEVLRVHCALYSGAFLGTSSSSIWNGLFLNKNVVILVLRGSALAPTVMLERTDSLAFSRPDRAPFDINKTTLSTYSNSQTMKSSNSTPFRMKVSVIGKA